MDLKYLDYKNLLYSPFISKILITVIILLIGITIGRIVSKIVYRILKELGLDSMIKKTTNRKISIERLISNFIAYFVYLVTIIMALSRLGLSTTALNIVIASILLIFVIIVFFILNYFLPNIIAGIFIKKKKFIKEQDYIKFGDKEGKIVRINLIETMIITIKGEEIYIPNSLLAKREITKLKRLKK